MVGGGYPLGALGAGLLESPLDCRVIVDGGEVFAGRAWQLTVASSGAFGGGSSIATADPGDGRLDVLVIPPGLRLILPLRALGMRLGNLADQPGVVHVRGEDVEARVEPGTPFDVDGEVVQAPARVPFCVRDGAFALVVS